MEKLLKTLIVLQAFRCMYNFEKRYEVDEEITDLTNFDEARIADLVERGIVAIGKENKKPNAGNGDGSGSANIDLSQRHTTVISQVRNFGDVEKLKQYLEQENASEKPRASVVNAIEARIADLEGDE
jgi:hypothetical protein